MVIDSKYADDISFLRDLWDHNEPSKETAHGPAEERKYDWKWIKARRIQNTRLERLAEKGQISRIPNRHRISHQP